MEQVTLSILTAAIAFFALIISMFSFFALRKDVETNRTNLQKTIFESLHKQFHPINEGFIEHNIPLPVYAEFPSDIPVDEVDSANRTAIMLLHQTNLMYSAFKNQDALGEDFIRYKDWWRRTVVPWVKSSNYLTYVYNRFKAGADLYSDDFVDWLKEQE